MSTPFFKTFSFFLSGDLSLRVLLGSQRFSRSCAADGPPKLFKFFYTLIALVTPKRTTCSDQTVAIRHTGGGARLRGWKR